MNTSPFPMDFEPLQRGSYIPPETVESATMVRRSDPSYRVRALGLRDQIRQWFVETHGDFVTIVSENDGLRILTHEEQADYAPQREGRAIRQIMVAQAEGRAVDLALLGDEQRARHERWLHRNAWRAQQLRKAPPPQLGA